MSFRETRSRLAQRLRSIRDCLRSRWRRLARDPSVALATIESAIYATLGVAYLLDLHSMNLFGIAYITIAVLIAAAHHQTYRTEGT